MEAARDALQLHIQAAITFSRQRDANNVAGIRNGKMGECRVRKNRATFWLGEYVR